MDWLSGLPPKDFTMCSENNDFLSNGFGLKMYASLEND